jgi:hypothetical protein
MLSNSKATDTQMTKDVTIMIHYEINENSSIDHLLEYSTFLIKHKIFDNKILNWQCKNVNLLRSRIYGDQFGDNVFTFI